MITKSVCFLPNPYLQSTCERPCALRPRERGLLSRCDTLVPPTLDLETPLPSIQTGAGKEALRETPSFVIAAHFMHTANVDPMSTIRREQGLRRQLKKTTEFQVHASFGFIKL